MPRLPPWIRLKMHTDGEFARVQNLVSHRRLHTVCQSAHCPNMHECWNRSTATFMILGNVCTRNCSFCAVESGQPGSVDAGEPQRVAQAASEMKLRHVVVTSVTRDDLPDGGAPIFAETIRAVREAVPKATIEVLTPDFQGRTESVSIVLQAGPDVFNHNLETVERLQPAIRPQASYRTSLSVLAYAAKNHPDIAVKSGIMLGLGENEAELFQGLEDLLSAGCELLTLGQYLAPTRAHLPVARFVTPAEFDAYAKKAREMGFKGVASGPMVRSSYKAVDLLEASAGK